MGSNRFIGIGLTPQCDVYLLIMRACACHLDAVHSPGGVATHLPHPSACTACWNTERGGVCTFCGAKVALDYKERIAQQAAAAADGSGPSPSADPDMAFGLTEGEESAATAAAVAFKDRLVEYDRNSAKRTTVIDDQSDYFEIDANAWLTDEVSEGKGACFQEQASLFQP